MHTIQNNLELILSFQNRKTNCVHFHNLLGLANKCIKCQSIITIFNQIKIYAKEVKFLGIKFDPHLTIMCMCTT